MSDVRVNREKGYFVVSEPVWSERSYAASSNVGDSVKGVAMHVIDEFDYYLDNDAMIDIREITDSGGVATLDIETEKGTVSLTVFRSMAEGERLELPLKKE